MSPDEAFAVLGAEPRLQILQALGDADGPLAYSELFDRIDYDDSANFTYHLEKLVGHFVRKTDEGYELRLTGRRVVEAILSGVVTENPVVERTATDTPCPYCGGSMEIGYHEEVVALYCTDCGGRMDRMDPTERWPIEADDFVGYVSLPPAGVADRTPTEAYEAAGIWTVADVQTIVRGVCPRCSARIDRSVRVCESHDPANGFCDRCDHQFAVSIGVDCTNCIFDTRSPVPTHLLGTTELVSFMTGHGIDPFGPNTFHLSACEEEVLSTDPLSARYTFTAEGDTLALTVDGDLSVVDATRERDGEAE